jgi:hypothetical protein
MRCWARTCTVLLLCLGTALPSRAEEFAGYGPVPVRNFQPIQLIFLNLPVDRARTLPPGTFDLYLESAESNEIATNQENIQATLKFETNTTVLGGTVGVAPGLDLGLDIPFVSRFGGFLDPFIDTIESAFGATNPERHLFPHNTFGGFSVYRGNTPLFQGRDQQLELGDLWASAKYEVWHPSGLPLLALRGAVKAPTGRSDGVFGSSKPDFGLGLAAEQPLLDWLVVYGNLNGIYPLGPITPGRLTVNPFLTQALAGEARLYRNVSFALQEEMYTSPFHGTATRLLDGTLVELTAGFNVAWGSFLFRLAAIDNLTGVVNAADFTVFLRMNYRR